MPRRAKLLDPSVGDTQKGGITKGVLHKNVAHFCTNLCFFFTAHFARKKKAQKRTKKRRNAQKCAKTCAILPRRMQHPRSLYPRKRAPNSGGVPPVASAKPVERQLDVRHPWQLTRDWCERAVKGWCYWCSAMPLLYMLDPNSVKDAEKTNLRFGGGPEGENSGKILQNRCFLLGDVHNNKSLKNL